MSLTSSVTERILNATADIMTNDGADQVSLRRVSAHARVDFDAVVSAFSTTEELLGRVIDREYSALHSNVIDNIERDPDGGLLSRICLYSLTAIYERPLSRALYLDDSNVLRSVTLSASAYGNDPAFAIRSDFVHRMQELGMVRDDVSAKSTAGTLTALSVGLAVTAPHKDLGAVSQGVCMMLSRAVDANVSDTRPGKILFREYAAALAV